VEKRFLAARVAAALRDDPSLDVRRAGGRLGELRVEVDGQTAVDVAKCSFPLPRRLTARVRAWLDAHPAGESTLE
jgi:hypothetical protein